MSKTPHPKCKAKLFTDVYECKECELTWGVSCEEPPECPQGWLFEEDWNEVAGIVINVKPGSEAAKQAYENTSIFTGASCRARQFSDQMRCDCCEQSWDMNDPEPPLCKQKCLELNFEPITVAIEIEVIRSWLAKLHYAKYPKLRYSTSQLDMANQCIVNMQNEIQDVIAALHEVVKQHDF